MALEVENLFSFRGRWIQKKINCQPAKSSLQEPQVNFSANLTTLSANNVTAFPCSIPKFVKYKTE
ncbi:MAG TPA: hypothetical protein DEB18_13440 [Leeuwenhoekiella sp.]|jgi:hypothetical protein|uniref:Uncharacterized protein n=1 Tax=Leeuwenhoekiella blandensis (strain CECT 7118 / CCUG 51940 / KCTC 22103 / MED217) TaxID=398720 RepID=A3XKA0_LEEBM|nr:hypothetical protein MED217_02675 [Leeuwenhoekiella blandensis MED217]MAO42639.1 hypothetical protein [Leeuwenhoekiella sp.]HBT10404.1 hypothetical protein [Leeuwenhoekiella sp.]|tara:strand:- start:1367 stop:1561 length:195 start_codon:yes stop_codon:yes gene_type:complete